jgi:uncharacterized protein YdaU (DUF1376 family)
LTILLGKGGVVHGLFWWIDRWRRSSAYVEMSLEEQGAYHNLLDEAWLRGGGIPNDPNVLAKACGDPRAWRRVRHTVMRKFRLVDGQWHNRTLDEVLHQSARRAKNQQAYRARRKGNGHA